VADPGSFETVTVRDVMVELRDGVRLATDLTVPAEAGEPLPGPWPTVLVRTAYDRGNFVGQSEFFASHGYLAVAQDVRGTFGSEGEFFAFVHEAEDGADVLAWLAVQPWSNGNIGMYHCSYMSWVQLAAMTQAPRSLKCIIPFGVAIDTFHHYAYPDGGLQLGLLRWVIYDVWRRAAVLHNDTAALAAIDELDFLAFAAAMPWQRGQTLLALSQTFEDNVFAYLENRWYNDFWSGPGQGFEGYFDAFPDVPTLWVSGWYDGYPRSVCDGYLAMCERGRRPNQHLLLGPWIHNQMSGTTSGDADFGAAADIDRLGVQLAFFDRHLKRDFTAPPCPRVRAFVMGGGADDRTAEGRLAHGGTWWQGDDWPPSEMAVEPLYFGGGGELRGAMSTQGGGSTTFSHDPADPIPSIAVPWMFVGYQPRGPHDCVEPNELIGNCTPGRPAIVRTPISWCA
jgi:putative CocE/NonD family hydrolase